MISATGEPSNHEPGFLWHPCRGHRPHEASSPNLYNGQSPTPARASRIPSVLLFRTIQKASPMETVRNLLAHLGVNTNSLQDTLVGSQVMYVRPLTDCAML